MVSLEVRLTEGRLHDLFFNERSESLKIDKGNVQYKRFHLMYDVSTQ